MSDPIHRLRPDFFTVRPAAPGPATPVRDFIHLSEGLSNAYLLVTGAGRIVVNTGMGFEGPIHREKFDAIFAVTDVIAIDAMRALEDNGLSIPADIAVVGFDDISLAAHVTPALTTVRQDIRQAAEGLVHGIAGLIEGKPGQSTQMAPRLVVRASCGAL